MRFSIHMPNNGYGDKNYVTVTGGKVELNEVTEDEAKMALVLISKAFAARFGATVVVEDPMSRIATCFEAMTARESARHEERSYDKERIEELEKELKMVKVRAALTEEVKGWMRGVHHDAVKHLDMRDLRDLRDHLPYEIGKLSFKEVLDLFIEEVVEAKHEVEVAAIPGGSAKEVNGELHFTPGGPAHANLDFQPGDRVQARSDTRVGTFGGFTASGNGTIEYDDGISVTLPLDDILHA